LREMEQAYERTGAANLRPDIVAYTTVLDAFAKSSLSSPSQGGRHRQQQQADIAMDLLDRMQKYADEEPNATFLNTWIHLLAKTTTAAAAAAAADGTHGTGKEASAAVAQGILCYMRLELKAGNELVRPCKITYTAVISVLAQVGTVAAAERAEMLLDELEGLWKKSLDRDYLPNAKTFASVLNAWAKSGSPDASARADDLLERMEQLYQETGSDDLKPNLIVFAQVFQILSKCRNSQSATRAKEVLQKMNTLHRAGCPNVRPDATTYAYVIDTFTKSGVENAAELATHVLKEVEEGYLAGMGELKPTGLLYSVREN
jgi:hypothetical protein